MSVFQLNYFIIFTDYIVENEADLVMPESEDDDDDDVLTINDSHNLSHLAADAAASLGLSGRQQPTSSQQATGSSSAGQAGAQNRTRTGGAQGSNMSGAKRQMTSESISIT